MYKISRDSVIFIKQEQKRHLCKILKELKYHNLRKPQIIIIIYLKKNHSAIENFHCSGYKLDLWLK